MKKLLYTSLFCFSTILTPYVSFAQQTINSPENKNVISVFEQQRPDYYTDGVKTGAFILRPNVNLESFYDDNIFADSSGEKSDLITSIKPSLLAESNWNRHQLFLNLDSRFVKYSDYTNEDFEDFSATAGGRLDIMYGTYLTGDATSAIRHEERSSPDDVNGIEPTKYIDNKARLGFIRDTGRVSLYIDGEANKLNYYNARTSGGSVIDNSIRDRNQYKIQTKIAYEYIPDYSAFIKLIYDQRKYDVTSSLDRDSQGYQINLGTDVNLTGKLKGDVFIGYVEQDYDDVSLKTIKSGILGGNLLWNVTPITSLRTGLNQSVNETITASSSGYLSSELYIAAEHELRRNILLGTSLGYVFDDYQGGSREDDTIKIGLSAKYLLRRGVSIKTGYDFVERDSNTVNNDFTDNRIMLNLTVGI